MKYNIYDVAKKSGVSVATVSKVLNNAETVRESNRRKVLQAMSELNYTPSATARSLAKGKSGVIGLVIQTITDTFLQQAIMAINDTLEANGYFLALSVIPQMYEETVNPYLFQQDRVDGLLLLSPLHEDEYILELKGKKIPFVLMDNQKYNPSVSTVLVDNYKGGCDVTNYLIGLGHKKIFHIKGPDVFLSSREREKAYKDTMIKAGLEPIVVETLQFEFEDGYKITKKLIQENNLPTAIFAADDHLALGVIDALKEDGFRVPDHVSVAGFDDQSLASQLHPLLTTVRQPAEEMGKKGVELLLKIIKGDLKRSATIKLEPQLIVRQSTAPPKKSE
ncbi:MAG: LacI family transcriptional regulator [Clostridia bacterium]|nr:LacI family transcriptional regulator [Clostridia bacterium]